MRLRDRAVTELLSAQGRAALCDLAAGRSLLAFDLDGTLAPIVAHPPDAQVPPLRATTLQALATRWPVAVLTGRSVADAERRLGFTPHALYGNHGAERAGESMPAELRQQLDGFRRLLAEHGDALLQLNIGVEDKGLSMALHYRQAPDTVAACQWLDKLVAAAGNRHVRAQHGHRVLNLTPRTAPDKGDALLSSMETCRCTQALVIGDDLNDEPAFQKAPPHSVTVRIGSAHRPTRARFRLREQAQMDAVLALLLALRPPPQRLVRQRL